MAYDEPDIEFKHGDYVISYWPRPDRFTITQAGVTSGAESCQYMKAYSPRLASRPIILLEGVNAAL